MTVVANKVHRYEDEFPRELGPPPVPNYHGKKLTDATKPTYIVELDAGAFRALWELLEAESKHRFAAAPGISAYRAYLRAVAAFRKAYWSENEAPEPVKPVRKLTRRRG